MTEDYYILFFFRIGSETSDWNL